MYPKWTDFPINEISYGFHFYGFDAYRSVICPDGLQFTHFWIDKDNSMPNEIEKYEKYIQQWIENESKTQFV